MAALFLILGGVFARAESLETVTLQLKWHHQFQFAGYYAAEARGFYREAGLKIRFREGTPDRPPTRELLSGRADYLVNGPGALLDFAEGAPLVALAAIFQHSPSILIARGAGIRTPSDLIGRRVMYNPETDPEFLGMCLREGIEPDRIVRVPHTFSLDALLDGRVDAATAYLTNEPFELAARGVSFHILRPVTYGIDFYGDCLFTTQKEIEEHPERVAAFLTASIQGWEYALSRPEEIIALLRGRHAVDASVEHLRHEAETMQELILPRFIPVGHMNPGRWRHIARTYAELGMMPADLSLDAFLYSADGDAVSLRRLLTWAGAAIVAVAAGLLIVLAFNRRLRQAVRERTEALHRANTELSAEVAERARVEAELRKSEENYRRLFEGGVMGVALADRRGRFLHANPAFLNMLGHDLQRLTDLRYAEIATGSAPPVETFLREPSGEDSASVWETTFRHRDGREFPVGLTGWPVHDADGEVAGFCVHARNLSRERAAEAERNRLERELDRARKFEALATLAGGVAHDFNNLLMGLQGRVSLMRLRAKDDSRILEQLDGMESHLHSAADLTRRLLSLARTGDFDRRPMDANRFVSDQVRRFARTREEIDLLETYADGLWPMAGDRNQLEQVLQNLFINAAQAMPGGGRMAVRTENVLLSETEVAPFGRSPGRYVRISVSDAGVGMDDAVQRRVFDPFFTTKTLTRGTGLGLASAYRIVLNHGGLIQVDSEKGRGSTFRVCLPVWEAELSGADPVARGEVEEGGGIGTIVSRSGGNLVRDSKPRYT
ncbi:MAG: ABC transporter substrate-binding protein [Thermodesulfobacteriota bacterium]